MNSKDVIHVKKLADETNVWHNDRFCVQTITFHRHLASSSPSRLFISMITAYLSGLIYSGLMTHMCVELCVRMYECR